MSALFILSIILNILAFLLTGVGTYIMLKGIDADEHLAADGLSSIKYFTVQSNLLFGIYAAIFAVVELIYGSAEAIPDFLYTLKYIFTVGVTLTMMTVLCYLGPIVEKSYPPLFKGANLYFHLLVPLLAIISFCFFEKSTDITLPEVFLGLIPFGAYGIYYTINALSHSENGQVDAKYDWYRFLAGGVNKAIPAALFMLFAAVAVCFGLWGLNLIND